ncbi:lysophospholipid acyltransferase family protein [Falsiroseomonas sp. HC035]|uniref:lysophospholipid acyltransferase family protein n=1 Tax=Falsiroseomonas sp. HC035 TaxID=3390999 RepID=UPI003D317B48
MAVAALLMVGNLYPAPPWAWAERKALMRHWLRDPIQGLADLIPHHALRLLPTEAASAVGAHMGLRSGSRRSEGSERARALFRALRPDADAAEIQALLVAHWSHVGRCFGEFAGLHRFWAEGRIEVAGGAVLREVQESGRPLVVAGLHVGNWEVVHAGLSGLGIRFSGIYQRLPNRFRMRIADTARNRIRQAGGPGRALAPSLGAVFEAHRLLESRDSALLYYVDEYWDGRVHAPALGRPLRMDGNIMRAVRLAAATGAAVVPAYALRLGDEARFRLTFLPEIPVGPPGRGRSAALEDIAALDRVVETVVRAHPEQWFMAHVFQPDR